MTGSKYNYSSDLSITLDTPTYSIAKASRLTGLSRGRVSRWLRGYKYSGGKLDPVIKRMISPKSTYASFLDLIDLLFVKKFIERGFSLQFIRKALDDARRCLGTPHFARSKFFTSSDEIIMGLPNNNMVALLTGGQRAITEVVEQVFDKLEFEEVTEFGFVCRWYPKGKSGWVVIDPRISFGRPTLIGHGVATDNIYDLYLGENKKVETVSEWFNIPIPKVQAAVQFEHSLWT